LRRCRRRRRRCCWWLLLLLLLASCTRLDALKSMPLPIRNHPSSFIMSKQLLKIPKSRAAFMRTGDKQKVCCRTQRRASAFLLVHVQLSESLFNFCNQVDCVGPMMALLTAMARNEFRPER
jgi:hypothetical protein